MPLAAILAAQIALSPAARAAPGDLDPTFGVGGRVVSSFGAGLDAASAVAVQPDGKIVIAGSAFNGDFLLARYNPGGTLDPSFGTGGLVTTDFEGSDGAVAISLRQGGKILAAGATTPVGGQMAFAAARYNADGTLDNSFGVGGKATAPYGANSIAMTIETDGSFDLAGTLLGAGADFMVARYKPDGSPDASFGTGGIVMTDFGAWDTAWAIVAQPDGKIIVGGDTGNGADVGEFALARYNIDGGLDATFGVAGKVATDFSAFDDGVKALAMTSDGKILAIGSTSPTGTTREFALAQYQSNGSLDATFGTSGKVTTDFGGVYASPSAVAIEPDGRIVAAGSSEIAGGTFQFALARYNPSGSIDTSFGSAGRVITDFPGSDDEVFAVAAQPDGNVVAAGATFTGIDGDVALARYQGVQPPVPSAPQISWFSPRSGPVGTTVTIVGSNLSGATSLTFNNTSQPWFSVDGTGTTITTTVPAGATSGPIRVWTPFGASTSTDSFTITTVRAHTRGVTLSLWGHLRVVGVITTTDAFAACSQGAMVKIQRHRWFGWHTLTTVSTDSFGQFRGWIPDRPGTYRAKLDETTLSTGDVCGRAFSPRSHHSE